MYYLVLCADDPREHFSRWKIYGVFGPNAKDLAEKTLAELKLTKKWAALAEVIAEFPQSVG